MAAPGYVRLPCVADPVNATPRTPEEATGDVIRVDRRLIGTDIWDQSGNREQRLGVGAIPASWSPQPLPTPVETDMASTAGPSMMDNLYEVVHADIDTTLVIEQPGLYTVTAILDFWQTLPLHRYLTVCEFVPLEGEGDQHFGHFLGPSHYAEDMRVIASAGYGSVTATPSARLTCVGAGYWETGTRLGFFATIYPMEATATGTVTLTRYRHGIPGDAPSRSFPTR